MPVSENKEIIHLFVIKNITFRNDRSHSFAAIFIMNKQIYDGKINLSKLIKNFCQAN